MAVFKCKMCGAHLEVAEQTTVATCEYCGTNQTLPRGGDENVQEMFNRATALRQRGEFDKAERLYEKMIAIDAREAEAHWGTVLCRFGIEYVDDPATGEKKPTCHRVSFEAVTADESYRAALECADTAQRALYEREARAIDGIQREILAVSREQAPYDVFICYKETDENGQRTHDSVIANDLYHELTQEGLRVFYAAISLEDQLGRSYEPVIFAALQSARVMLVIGTKPQYFEAPWVRNEWSRYLRLMEQDRKRLLIPCYRDMDAYELPEEFAYLQAQDMAKIGFVNDVVRGIRKVIGEAQQKTETSDPYDDYAPDAQMEPLLERAFLFLEDGDFDTADAYCEKVLDQDPHNARAYLGKLMVDLRVRRQTQLAELSKPFDNNVHYRKILRFASPELVEKLQAYLASIRATYTETAYRTAVGVMQSARTSADLLRAQKQLEACGEYRDAKELALRCAERIAQLERSRNRSQMQLENAALEQEYRQLHHGYIFAQCRRISLFVMIGTIFLSWLAVFAFLFAIALLAYLGCMFHMGKTRLQVMSVYNKYAAQYNRTMSGPALLRDRLLTVPHFQLKEMRAVVTYMNELLQKRRLGVN